MPQADDPAISEKPSVGSGSEARGLWDGRERGSCGIGFVADVAGRPARRVLDLALEALANLAHRGAVGADGLTSDGTGVLTRIPWRMLRRVTRPSLRANGAANLDDDDLAVGVLFLPPVESKHHDAARELVESILGESDLRAVAWRDVPVDPSVLGSEARATLPAIRQVVIERPADVERGDAFERRLYLARKRLERAARELADAAGDVRAEPVVVSLSHRTIVYKSMAPATELAVFYPDLADPDYATPVALFHQRFSTNTWPSWRLAQPFRLLAHNGEINTIEGNREWMRTREPQLRSAVWGEDLAELLPVLDERGSDSAMLDQMLEFLVLSGRDPLHASMMTMPAAGGREPGESPNAQRAFYEYHATLLEPWDGPAAVVATDGRLAVAGLDRNGLRPQRYWRTADGLVIVGSEAGMCSIPESDVVEKGRLGPGQRLVVDMVRGRLLRDAEAKAEIAGRRPYGEWLAEQMVSPPEEALAADSTEPALSDVDDATRRRVQVLFGYTKEAVERILDPMLDGDLPVGSMGNDAPLAVLSRQPQLLYSYFKQRFAQVTNPPIDPIRERLVFDLETFVGGWGNLLDETPGTAHLIRLPSPVVSTARYRWLLQLDDPAFRVETLDATWAVAHGVDGLRPAVEALMSKAEAALEDGARILVLSDRRVGPGRAPIPMLLATSAVHHHLVRQQKRMRVSLVCDTAEPREDHHVACLVAYGATLVHPYLAYASAIDRAEERGLSPATALANYRSTLDKGLLKVMSRLGVCPMTSYHGAKLFEALGLDRDLVERYFTGTPSRVAGVGPKVLAADVLELHAQAYGAAFDSDDEEAQSLPDRGIFRFRRGGEHHDFQPLAFKNLHRAVRSGDSEAFERYSESVDQGQPSRLRDLLAWRRAPEPLALDDIEPATEIAQRFVTAAMSHGALSREAHETIAIAMNRIGGRSNSGEGGEAEERYRPYREGRTPAFAGTFQPAAGDWGDSAIKQVASGRFGVGPGYLASARELEIKMAQGSKPGEGGQIPGHKVTDEIARLRRSVPGVPLISPPPHHDIYSIEDLAQLIYDLKRVNPRARVGVKLVSLAGVGTIACGVVKAGADYVLISGDDGGTGASPLSSIKHAGMPWELGLVEAQQALVANGLRERVSLRVDGGLKTGRDIALATLLGAEEFGFGTAPLIAIGCVMARQCHLDTCPVGVATQRDELRERFPGTPEHVVAFMLFVAEQVRHVLAQLGLPRLEDAIGRFDLVESREDRAPVRGLDLAKLLVDPDPTGEKPRRRRPDLYKAPTQDETLDDRLASDALRVLEETKSTSGKRPPLATYEITNRDRSVGARLSGELALRGAEHGDAPSPPLRVVFEGVAGQSFGAFLSPGLDFRLRGEAQDYLGKGMAGGRIAVRPPEGARYVAGEQTIAGNTLLYGATGGELFAAGRVGERFCVRNSGATAVVEGCGDHGCEYMTAGVAVILGPTGRNFGAGMSGGKAYVLDPERRLENRLHDGMVRVDTTLSAADVEELRYLLGRHVEITQSRRAAEILADWPARVRDFVRVVPKDAPELPPVALEVEPAGASEEASDRALGL